MAGAELEKYAIGHEMSNQGNATQSWNSLEKSVAIYKLTASFLCIAQSLLTIVLDHGGW